MKKTITRILFAAVLVLAATSCLQHKALGQFFGLYPQNVQLNYDLSNFAEENPTAVTGAPMTDEEIVENFDINQWWVYAFPKSGNPTKKTYEFRFYEYNPQTYDYDKKPENIVGAFLPIFSEGDYEHFRGIYDFVVASEPLHENPETLSFGIASGNSLAELETREPETISSIGFERQQLIFNLPGANMPVNNGCPYTRDGQYYHFYYGTLANELVPGSDQENTTHEADVLIKECSNFNTWVDIPNINLTQETATAMTSRIASEYSICLVTGLAQTWKIGQGKPGDKAYNLINYANKTNDGEYLYFQHSGKSPAADKVELYVMTVIENLNSPGSIEYYLFYRKWDITDSIVNEKAVDLGPDIEWKPDFNGKTPSTQDNFNWYEINK